MALTKPSRGPTPETGATAPDAASLVARLDAARAADRREAARGLALHPSAAPELARRIATEPDASVRAVLFSSLGRMGGDAAVAALLPLLRSDEAALRNGALEVLSALPGPVAPCMESLLMDPDSDVRIFAVNLLGQLAHPQVTPWLAGVLRDETAANVVAAALDAAAEIAAIELDEPVRTAAARFPSDPFIAFAAALVRRRIDSA